MHFNSFVVDCGPRIERIADFGLWIADCELRNPLRSDLPQALLNPQSAIGNPKSRNDQLHPDLQLVRVGHPRLVGFPDVTPARLVAVEPPSERVQRVALLHRVDPTANRVFLCDHCQRRWEEPPRTGRPKKCPSCGHQEFHRVAEKG